MNQKSTLFNMTSCALMAALMCALCPISIPIGPVPITLGILAILISVYLLGTWRAMASYTVYILLGAMGLPVFSNYGAGLAKIAGPTGGYLVGFWLMILVGGLIMEYSKRNLIVTMLGMALGVAADYVLGTAWFVIQTGRTVTDALAVCVTPFVPFDLGKVVVAVLFGKIVRDALVKAKLLQA